MVAAMDNATRDSGGSRTGSLSGRVFRLSGGTKPLPRSGWRRVVERRTFEKTRGIVGVRPCGRARTRATRVVRTNIGHCSVRFSIHSRSSRTEAYRNVSNLYGPTLTLRRLLIVSNRGLPESTSEATARAMTALRRGILPAIGLKLSPHRPLPLQSRPSASGVASADVPSED